MKTKELENQIDEYKAMIDWAIKSRDETDIPQLKHIFNLIVFQWSVNYNTLVTELIRRSLKK